MPMVRVPLNHSSKDHHAITSPAIAAATTVSTPPVYGNSTCRWTLFLFVIGPLRPREGNRAFNRPIAEHPGRISPVVSAPTWYLLVSRGTSFGVGGRQYMICKLLRCVAADHRRMAKCGQTLGCAEMQARQRPARGNQEAAASFANGSRPSFGLSSCTVHIGRPRPPV
jgi:hypothetical protein